MVTFRGQLGVGKVSSRVFCEYFGIVGFILVLLGQPQSAVQYLTLRPLLTSVGQTIGCDAERLDMSDRHLMVHIVCHF